MTRKKPKITERRPAGPDHQVVQMVGGRHDLYRRSPCPTCPFRKDMVGEFPAEAFRISAGTAYDVSFSTFACHTSGLEKPATCAGFLLKNSQNNIAVRIRLGQGEIDMNEVHDGGHPLFDSYRSMAIANGVDPADPVLAPCRGDDE